MNARIDLGSFKVKGDGSFFIKFRDGHGAADFAFTGQCACGHRGRINCFSKTPSTLTYIIIIFNFFLLLLMSYLLMKWTKIFFFL